MRVLVTGGGGFLGRHIIQQCLERGYEVTSLGRSAQPGLEDLGVNVIEGDIAVAKDVSEAVVGQDAVFHVAAKAGVWGRWKDYFEPNVRGTLNVIEACKLHGLEKLVYTSTPSVVFNKEDIEDGDEELPYAKKWLCHYAHTKSIAEKEVLEANGEGGLKTVALRPHLIWGVGDNHLVPKIIKRGKAGRIKVVGDGENMVDMTHVKNAAHAHMLALDGLEKGTCAGEAYFISDDAPVYLWGWVDDLFKALNIPLVKKSMSMRTGYVVGTIIEYIARILSVKSDPPLTRFLALQLGKNHYFDISKAKRDLGYEPVISNEEGLRELTADLLSR